MNNNNMNYNNDKFNMNSLGQELAGNGPFRCDKCSMSHSGLKRIKNICPNCFMLEIITLNLIFLFQVLTIIFLMKIK